MPDRPYLLDAPALLALIRNEPGSERVKELLDSCQIHALNLAEVARKLTAKGMPAPKASALLDALNLPVIEDFSAAQAYAAAELLSYRLGLSLGDAVCLVVAKWTGMTAITADRRWSEIEDVEIVQIRS